jgi:signal transduction histidine kinase
VTRFSEFAKMPQPRLKPVDVNELLRAALKEFEPQFRVVGRPPITPELYLDSGVGKIQGDADLLRKALENLLLHSIDTMPAGGALTIRTGQANGIVRIEISGGSTGSAQDSARPFSAFRIGQAPGTGLGLPTTQAIVTDHGGRFFAESVPGVGTTFRLEFAVAPESTPPAAVQFDLPRRERKRELPEIPHVEAEATAATTPQLVEAVTTTTATSASETALPEPSLPEPSLKND